MTAGCGGTFEKDGDIWLGNQDREGRNEKKIIEESNAYKELYSRE